MKESIRKRLASDTRRRYPLAEKALDCDRLRPEERFPENRAFASLLSLPVSRNCLTGRVSCACSFLGGIQPQTRSQYPAQGYDSFDRVAGVRLDSGGLLFAIRQKTPGER
jgi:hypothetical protein